MREVYLVVGVEGRRSRPCLGLSVILEKRGIDTGFNKA